MDSAKARRIRVGVLLAVLAAVLAYAALDRHRRLRRKEWLEPLPIALVVLRRGQVDDDAIAALRSRLPALEAQLGAELQRHRATAMRPFSFVFHGPVDVAAGAPLPDGFGAWELVVNTYRRWRYTRSVDAAAGVGGGYASRIYLVVKPGDGGGQLTIEGTSELNGRVGMVEVELDRGMVDFALFVVTHELLHTLGASDKYDASGHARVPDGLADPTQTPLYPQARAEVMARNRPLGGGVEKPPSRLSELAVGELTAREIGWRK